MVMAAGTAERLAEHRAANGVDLLVSNIEPLLLGFNAEQHLGTDDQKAGGNPLTVSLLNGVERQKVTGQLFEEESVKGQVRIDGLDDPVSIAPGFPEQKILVQSVRVSVAGQIQPVPAPAPAEFWRCQQLVDDGGQGFRSGRLLVPVDVD